MRALLLLALSALATSASAGGMSPVAKEKGYCFHYDGTCREWVLDTPGNVRLIAQGYETGIDYSFYSRDDSGKYQHLLRIRPVLQDDSRKGSLFWGYSEDISDLAPSSGKKTFTVLAAFDDSVKDVGEVYSPRWQKQVPAILFVGQTTHPDKKVAKLRFKAIDLDALKEQAKTDR